MTVTNPKLLTQLGADADLNHARYTRYSRKGAGQPDAILITVPGFEGGASGFQILAENLMQRAATELGLVFEVWAFDRRSNQLEDTEGLDLAEKKLDPQLGLDWLFGSELGLPLSPELVAGPNRRAVFYNTSSDVPFMANWTPLVHSQDIDAVVEAARAAARNGNVFLGGHSAGTGFIARYAATDFELAGSGPPQPGFAKLRGLVLLEGGGGSIGSPPSAEALDRIEARFDGGLFGAVRDNAPRCVDGATACTVATEAVDCAAFANVRCTEPTSAYATLLGGLAGPEVYAAVEPVALQAVTQGESSQVLLQVDQNGVPGNTPINAVLGLAALVTLPVGTAPAAIGSFIDDDGFISSLASFVATSVGAPGPQLGGLLTWLTGDELIGATLVPNPFPNNGPPPTTLPGGRWGVEREDTNLDRMLYVFFRGGTNFVDWYYPSSGLGVTSGLGGLDSTALSADPPLGRGRRDIENLTQAPAIDVPVIAFGGSNGLTPVPGNYVAFAQTIAPCAAATCDGTPRVVNASSPNPAFPSFGGIPGGFEVHMSEGYSHVDVLTADDTSGNQVIGPLMEFMARNLD